MTVKVTELEWQRVSHILEEHRGPDGTIPAAARRIGARQLGVSERQLRRLLADPPRPEVARQLTDEQLAYVAAHGTPTAAWRALARDGKFSGSLSSFGRRLAAVHRSLRLAITLGEEAMRDSYTYLKWEAPTVNDTWQQDSAWSDVTVLDGRTRVQPVIEVIIDDASRLIVAAELWPGPPDSELATTAVARAVSGCFTPDGAQAKPRVIRHDQGAYYTADHYVDALARAGILSQPVMGRSPHLKGKVERVIRTMKDGFFASLPGTHRVAHALGDGESTRHDQRDRLLTFDEVRERLAAWVRSYNTEHRHSSLGGRTPAEAYLAGAESGASGIDEPAMRALLRRPSQLRKVSKNGIRWANRDYTHPKLENGSVVEVAPRPDDPDSLEVYVSGVWLCTAEPHDRWLDRAPEFYAERRRDQRQARRIRARASQLRSTGVPSLNERDDADHDDLVDDLLDDVGAPDAA